jgi:hypothetical protein
MADITVTAANVQQSSAAKKSSVVADVAITAGQLIYIDATTGGAKLALASGTEAQAAVVGIAINDAAIGQPITYAEKDVLLGVGGTVVPGTGYILSGVAGAFGPSSATDLPGTGEFITAIGVAVSVTEINLQLSVTGTAAP